MNRRNFLGNLLIAGASFAILPGAGRIWRAQRRLLNPDWVNAPFGLTQVFWATGPGYRFPGPMIFPSEPQPMGWLIHIDPQSQEPIQTRYAIDPASGFLRKVEKWL